MVLDGTNIANNVLIQMDEHDVIVEEKALKIVNYVAQIKKEKILVNY